jgi:hypothetical protein
MNNARLGLRNSSLVLLLFVSGLAPARAQGPSSVKVKGALTQIDGVPVLKVWGSPREQGYAHGYLVAEKAVRLLDRVLANGIIFTPESFQKQMVDHLDLMTIDPVREEELRGMLAGIEAKFGGPAEVPSLGRALRYEDLAAVNCIDLKAAQFGCSSFAAWGPMTADGATLCGHNLDWPLDRDLAQSQLIFVRLPSPGSNALGLVSVFFLPCIGCVTAMNSEGVALAQHDAMGKPPTMAKGFTSRTLMQRAALEAARARSASKDVEAIFKKQHSFLGENMIVAWPFDGHASAVVFEHDAGLKDGDGLTTRKPTKGSRFLVCTNHYRERQEAQECKRFASLTEQLRSIAESDGKERLTVKKAWRLLESVPIEGLATYHRAVFEPNKKLMHVAFPEGGDPKTRGKIITLDVAKLLEPLAEPGK